MKQHKLYSLKQIKAAALAGSPLISAFMLSANYNAFGERRNARLSWLFAGTLFFLLVLIKLLDSTASTVLFFSMPLLNFVLVSRITLTYQGEQISKHVKEGGEVRKWRLVTLVIILGIIITFLIAFGLSRLIGWTLM
jgi:hypothetical protein